MFLWEFIVKDMLFWFFGRNFILFIFYIKSVNPLHELRQRKLENISIDTSEPYTRAMRDTMHEPQANLGADQKFSPSRLKTRKGGLGKNYGNKNIKRRKKSRACLLGDWSQNPNYKSI